MNGWKTYIVAALSLLLGGFHCCAGKHECGCQLLLGGAGLGGLRHSQGRHHKSILDRLLEDTEDDSA